MINSGGQGGYRTWRASAALRNAFRGVLNSRSEECGLWRAFQRKIEKNGWGTQHWFSH
jgi:hypothetical protein